MLKTDTVLGGPACFPVTWLTASLAGAQGHTRQVLLRKSQARPSAGYLGYKKLPSACAKPFQKRSKAPLNLLRINDVDQRWLSMKIS